MDGIISNLDKLRFLEKFAMKYDAVIFDLMGTLVDNHTFPNYRAERWRELMSTIAGILGLPYNGLAEQWHATAVDRNTGVLPTIESTFERICSELGVLADNDSVAEARGLFIEHYRRALTPRPDALATIDNLKGAGHKVGLISDCTAVVSLLWPETPFSVAIETAVLSCEVGMMKPDPRTYALACERLDVAPQNCLYVGDGASTELTGASKVGMHPVQIRVPYEEGEDPSREDWDGIKITSLGEVLSIVARH